MPKVSTYVCHVFRQPLLRGCLCLCTVLLLLSEQLNAASTNIPVVAVEQSDADMYKIFEGFGSKSSSQPTPYQTALAAANDANEHGSETERSSVRLKTDQTQRSHSLSILESPQQTPAGSVGSTKFYDVKPSNTTVQKSRGANPQTQPITPKNTVAQNQDFSSPQQLSSPQTPRKLNPTRVPGALKTARYNQAGQNANAMKSANYSEESDQSDVDLRSLVQGGSAQFDVEYEENEEYDEEETALNNPPQAPTLSRRNNPPQPPQLSQPPQSVQRSALSELDADLTSDHSLTPAPMYAENAAETLENPDAIAETGESDSILDKAFPGMREKSRSKLTMFSTDSNTASVLNVMGCLCVVLGVFFAFVLFMRKVGPKTGKHIPREALENVGQFALNPKMQLNLLRLGNRLILVATTQDGVVETLTEINSPDEVSQILGICRKIDPNSSQAQFQSVLDEFAQAKTPPGFFGTANEKAKTSAEPSLSSLLSSGLQDRGPKRKSGVAYG